MIFAEVPRVQPGGGSRLSSFYFGRGHLAPVKYPGWPWGELYV